MTSLSRWLILFAATSIAVATGLGAWASHGLAGQLDAAALSSFQTGVDYQFFHSLGLLAIAALGSKHVNSRALAIGVVLLVAGILLFCGGVYTAAFDGPAWIRRLAPTGGVSLIVGWLVLAAGVVVNRGAD